MEHIIANNNKIKNYLKWFQKNNLPFNSQKLYKMGKKLNNTKYFFYFIKLISFCK